MSYNYIAAFTDLNEACLALRRLLVTLKRLHIIKHVTPIYKPLRKRYFYAHMHRGARGDSTLYIPAKRGV